MLNHEKRQYSFIPHGGNMKLEPGNTCLIPRLREAHGGHGGKNLSQRIYAGRPHKYTDSMYYLHFLHELHGEKGCSLWSKQFHFRVFSCFSW